MEGPHLIKQARLIDPTGFSWKVQEVTTPGGADDSPAASGAAPSESSLYFFSRYATRKLSVYPANWLELPAAELERLRQEALPVSRFDVPDAPLEDRDAALAIWHEPSPVQPSTPASPPSTGSAEFGGAETAQ